MQAATAKMGELSASLTGLAELVTDQAKKQFAGACLMAAPEYFWRVPASSSGKYHPAFAAGEGGLVRHTAAAVKVALELLPAYPHLQKESDDIIIALLLHDTLKHGWPDAGHTVPEHPFLPRRYYREFAPIIGQRTYDRIMRLVDTHMGIWTPGKKAPKPQFWSRMSPADFVHLCDHIVSRKQLEVLFRT